MIKLQAPALEDRKSPVRPSTRFKQMVSALRNHPRRHLPRMNERNTFQSFSMPGPPPSTETHQCWQPRQSSGIGAGSTGAAALGGLTWPIYIPASPLAQTNRGSCAALESNYWGNQDSIASDTMEDSSSTHRGLLRAPGPTFSRPGRLPRSRPHSRKPLRRYPALPAGGRRSSRVRGQRAEAGVAARGRIAPAACRPCRGGCSCQLLEAATATGCRRRWMDGIACVPR